MMIWWWHDDDMTIDDAILHLQPYFCSQFTQFDLCHSGDTVGIMANFSDCGKHCSDPYCKQQDHEVSPEGCTLWSRVQLEIVCQTQNFADIMVITVYISHYDSNSILHGLLFGQNDIRMGHATWNSRSIGGLTADTLATGLAAVRLRRLWQSLLLSALQVNQLCLKPQRTRHQATTAKWMLGWNWWENPTISWLINQECECVHKITYLDEYHVLLGKLLSGHWQQHS
jgi:hypothetical protein